MIRAILLLAALPMAAHAESWRAASYGENYPGVVVLIDADSVVRADGQATFRAQSLFEVALTSNITRAIEKMEADCSAMTYQISNSLFYSGTQFVEEDVRASKTFTAVEGSTNWGMLLTACGQRDYQSPVVVDPMGFADDYFYELAMTGDGF